MQLNKNIAISDSGFIFNPSSGDSFSTNQIGLHIINLLKEEKNKEQIIEAISEKYMVDRSNAEKDFGDFLTMLKSYQLLQEE
jgi:hypothetical protein